MTASTEEVKPPIQLSFKEAAQQLCRQYSFIAVGSAMAAAGIIVAGLAVTAIVPAMVAAILMPIAITGTFLATDNYYGSRKTLDDMRMNFVNKNDHNLG